jgi:hypothetical protein
MPENIEQYAEDYDARALWPVLSWISGMARDPHHVFQYQEVLQELNKYSPRYGCALIFARFVLLPKLATFKPITDLPESLVVVLNTLHLVCTSHVTLLEVHYQSGPHLRFTVECESWSNGQSVKYLRTYLLQNYEDPDWTGLTLLSENQIQ